MNPKFYAKLPEGIKLSLLRHWFTTYIGRADRSDSSGVEKQVSRSWAMQQRLFAQLFHPFQKHTEYTLYD